MCVLWKIATPRTTPAAIEFVLGIAGPDVRRGQSNRSKKTATRGLRAHQGPVRLAFGSVLETLVLFYTVVYSGTKLHTLIILYIYILKYVYIY